MLRINGKKSAAAAATLLLGAMSMVACSSKEETAPSATGQGATEKPKPTITVSAYERGRVPAEEGTMEKNRWTDWINANGPVNVKYVLVPRNESAQKFNTLFASNTAPDIINEYDTNYRNKLYDQKQIQPIDELIEKYSTDYKQLMEQYPTLRKVGTKPDGKLYETGRLQNTGALYAVIIRADWLEKLNLSVPQTPEELLEVAKAFTFNDPDGNGKKDTFGISLSSFSGVTIDNMFGNVGFVLENDTISWNWDRFKAAMSFKKQLFDQGVVDKDFLTDKNGEKAKKDWLAGKLGIYTMQHAYNDAGYTNYETLKSNVPTAKILTLPLPKTQFGQFSMELGNPVQMTTVINIKAKDPEAAIKFIDFMSRKDTMLTLRNGLEGVHHTLDDNGCAIPIDAEKNTKELGYTGDYWMMSSTSFEGKCSSLETKLKPDTQNKKDYLEFFKNKTVYESPDRPYPAFALSEHMPTLPTELQTISNDLRGAKLDEGKLGEAVTKAIVSGSSYSVDQAMADAKSAWDKLNGKKLEEFYAKWYAENKEHAFLTKDVYQILADSKKNQK
ncbi:extracellular solute-binding protein [Paenibacillus sp. YN15]|uniref:extracellular solute-binding protein n=1 Tax=Paenibacillus sp. YN15 TaxID=1742774 RepID=UPI0015EC99A1|nr:extracellular solute-binding protein [Paenibacillus sp. YN15]